ncbi:taurine catabolism dioxygenase [Seiridium cupressi]
MTDQHGFQSFTFAGQQDTVKFGFDHSAPFPLALRPTDGWKPTLKESVDKIRQLSDSGAIFEQIQHHGGAVLIRGLPIQTPHDYSEVAHAFGFPPHEEVGRPPLRTVLAKNVKTANEGLGLAAALKQQAPEFAQNLLEKGVKYIYRYGLENVVSNTGTSVLGAYGQHVSPGDDKETIRRRIEKEVRRHSNCFEWHQDGSLSVTHMVPIIRKHEETGCTTWFGNLTSAWGRSKYHGATAPPYRGDDDSYHPPPLYGDRTKIESRYLDLALDLAESSQVLVSWERGDIVLLENYAVMHSRSPWVGNRTVLAALWDFDKIRISDYPREL